MTATRVIAAEYDEYAEHIVKVADRLARGRGTGRQWVVDQRDLAQVMCLKGWKDRLKIHGAECQWPVIPEGKSACCALAYFCLQNAATDHLRWAKWGGKAQADESETKHQPREIPVDPATLAEGNRTPVGCTTHSRDPWETVSAIEDYLHRAMAELPPEQREAVWSVRAEGNTLDETARDLGVPVQTVYYRSRVGLAKLELKMKLLLAALPD